MKIALCLHGLVGSIKGKNCDMLGGSDEVLDISYKHNKENILGDNVDVFIHSWSTELKDKMVELYQPKSHIIEEQIEFKVPDYIKAAHRRAFAHISRWYSYQKSVELMAQTGIEYDFVLVQRFDLVWNIAPAFDTLDPEYFYVGKCSLDSNREWSDRWFISNVPNMINFSYLLDAFPNYMGPGGISSHFLTRHHAKQLGLKEKFIYTFGGYGDKPNDYNEVRRQYYGDK